MSTGTAHRRKARAQFAPTPPECSSSRLVRHSWPGSGQDPTRPIRSALMSPSTTILGLRRLDGRMAPNLITATCAQRQSAAAGFGRRRFVVRPPEGGRVDPLVSVRTDIASAIAARRPVVALESTVIAHGLPRPHNVDTAFQMEAAVRGAGALPATI